MYVYSLIVNVCRRPRSSLPIRYVNHTIDRIKYLFQNGRLLLTCIILLSPISGNPDVFDITRSPALIPVNHTSVVPIVNKHFKTVFHRFVLLCCCDAQLQPQLRRDILLIFAIVYVRKFDGIVVF